MKKFIPIEANTLVYLYELYTKGAKNKEITEKTGIHNVHQARTKLQAFLAGKKSYKHQSSEFMKATKLIQEKRNHIGLLDMIEKPNNKVVFKDEFDVLNEAVQSLQNAIDYVITTQVEKRVKETEKENKSLKQTITEQESELLELKNAAKNSNWINSLRHKWG